MSELNVLLIGGGAREHAMAFAISDSPRLGKLFVAPGNDGMEFERPDLDVDDHAQVVEFCRSEAVDLVVVGPEVPLVNGLADVVLAAGIKCFGPTAEVAQLEGSKSFTRDFAAKHNIPGPKWQAFTDSAEAISWVKSVGKPFVVKADGLAAGKGVTVCDTVDETINSITEMLDLNAFGESSKTILLEERLIGQEVSLFGVSDGKDVVMLSTAQDHKRAFDGDNGPNTGGMGCVSPVPGTKKLRNEFIEKFLKPVVDGMAEAGTPYVGTIYAGIMLTDEGPKLIEYNCRFGDPEAEIIIPKVESDFLELLWSAATGSLSSYDLKLAEGGYAVTVTIAAEGYPTSPIAGLDVKIPDTLPANTHICFAGVKQGEHGLVTAGGRVLNVVGTAKNLPDAVENAYELADSIAGNGLFMRQDIGHHHYTRPTSAYERAGVSIDAGAETTERISASVKSTHTDAVVSGLGAFGGVLDVSDLKNYESPLLVSSTDGVGTKTMLAAEVGIWEGIGQDLVNHCINDVLVQGAKPLFFMDTVASQVLEPEVVGQIVDGMALSCRQSGCVLLGGETAEMGDLLTTGGVDVSGTLVGVVEKKDLLPTGNIQPGHLLVGLASSGLHTNGYSLARKTVSGVDLGMALPGAKTDISLGEALLAPHRSYLPALQRAIADGLVDGLAHITGGGFYENVPRVLPPNCGAVIDTTSWTVPALFEFLVSTSGVSTDEAYRVFNMGVGMIAIVDPVNFSKFEDSVDETVKVIGSVTAGEGVICNHG